MYDRFMDKEAMLADFYKHKTFLANNRGEGEHKMDRGKRKKQEEGCLIQNGKLRNGRGQRTEEEQMVVKDAEEELSRRSGVSSVVRQDLLRFVILHLFFLSSTYFHYRIFATVVQNCLSLSTFIL